MVQLSNLHFSYRRGRSLFHGLDLTLTPGNVYGLLGKNGAGKTSLLRLMGGLLFPQQGLCTVNGQIASRRTPQFLKDVFFIPEEFEFPPVQIKDYVRVNAPFYPKFDHDKFLRYLDEFELLSTQKLTELSHGQKKKVFTGFALSTNASLLIMDEPTNGLDIPSKAQFRRLIASAVDENRVVIISTHQVRDLENLIDPIIIIDQSQILIHATMEAIGETLSFSTVSQESDVPPDAILSEPSVRGISVVSPAAPGQFSNKVDLELLFNAAISHPLRIKSLFASNQ